MDKVMGWRETYDVDSDKKMTLEEECIVDRVKECVREV